MILKKIVVMVDTLWDYADTIFPLLTIIIFCFKYKKIREEKEIFSYLLVSLIIFFSANIIADKGGNNHFLYHLFSLLQFYILLFYFRKLLVVNSLLKILKMIYPIFFIINIFYFDGLSVFNSTTASFNCILFIYLSIRYYFSVINYGGSIAVSGDFNFYVVTAILIYAAGSLPIFIFYKYAPSYKEFFVEFWKIQVVILAIKYSLLIKAILCLKIK